MSFTPFTPKQWQDSPNDTTPLEAAALIDLEERVTEYTEDTAIPASSINKPSGIARLGSDGTVGGLGGSPLSSTLLTITQRQPNLYITSGALTNRGSAVVKTAGSVYNATDVNQISLSDGANWQPLTNQVNIGTVTMWAGTATPVDPDGIQRWMICNGASLSRTTYSTLFSRIGTTYGSADSSHFNLPNAQGVVIMGAGQGTVPDATLHTQDGLQHGTETVGLVEANNGPHSHGGSTGNSYPIPGNPQGGAFYILVGQKQDVNSAGVVGNGNVIVPESSTSTSEFGSYQGLHAHGISSDGSGTPHANLQPYLVMYYIIKVL